MPILALVLLILVGILVLIPISIVQRFRVGRARRRARGWVATLNLIALAISMLSLLGAALITTRWVPQTLTYTLVGLGIGGCLGALGLVLTRWEDDGRHRHFTPNPWLVLLVTLVVALRLMYGLWRTWDAWYQSVEQGAWVAASGAAGSMSAGAVVLGYYVVFWWGVRRRVERR